MGVIRVITNSVSLCMTLMLLLPSVNGNGVICSSRSVFVPVTICDDDEYCCGDDNTLCCKSVIPFMPPGPGRSQEEAMEAVAAFIVLMAIMCCCICCYRCCCRRTTSRGFVYSTPGPATTVSVTLPPQQNQQVPYPTVVPYPQQTPYPPQYNPPTNPYYGMPPPAYGVAVQSGNQQASAPSAPYIQS